jgi:hypothetical protein
MATYSITSFWWRSLRIAVVIVALAAGVVGGVSADGSAESPAVDPHARSLLKQMGDYLAAYKEFSFEAEVTTGEVAVGIQKIHTTDVIEAVVRRPDKLWIETRGDVFYKRFWYDGSSVAVMSLEENFYAITKAPSKIDAALDEIMEKYGVTTPVVDFLLSSPYDALTKDVTGAVYAGLHKVDGVECHHLAFTQDKLDWQIWIEDGKRMVPRKFVVTYKSAPGSPETVTIFKNWDFSTKHPDHLFDFKPPANARKIEFLPLTQM